MPQISVIVPVYNVESYLCRCVDSILRQSFKDFELILVDDGSPDNCGVICDEYAQKDNRVHVIHQKNGGLSAARNAGIEWANDNSDSEWISFVDSDDWIHTSYLEKLLNAVKENNVSISLCEYNATSGIEKEDIKNEKCTVSIISPEEYYVQNNTNATVAWGKLYKKSCFRSIRYPIGKIHEDEAVTHCLLFEFRKIAVVKETLYFYYVNPLGITKSQWNPRRLDSVDAMEKQMHYMKKHGYKVAHVYSIKKYVVNLASQIMKIIESDKRIKSKYLGLLRFKLKKNLLRYSQIIAFKDNIWIYECAFPKIVSVYWIGKTQIDKIKRRYHIFD